MDIGAIYVQTNRLEVLTKGIHFPSSWLPKDPRSQRCDKYSDFRIRRECIPLPLNTLLES